MSVSDRKIIEAMLFLADDPLPASAISEVLEKPRVEVEGHLQALRDAYYAEERGFELREVAGGWRLYTAPDCAPWLERFVTRHSTARLTPAALEVLAIIAYRQPISRAQIAELRGVDSDRVVKTLTERGLVEECGRARGAGSAVLFRVTDYFLERMGLRSAAELPPLATFMPDAEAVEDMEAKLSPGL